MDLVDIDKVLDDLEEKEGIDETVAHKTQKTNTNNNNAEQLQKYRLMQKLQNDRKIKVSSVLSSLNDYVDYEKRASTTATEELMKPNATVAASARKDSGCETVDKIEGGNKEKTNANLMETLLDKKSSTSSSDEADYEDSDQLRHDQVLEPKESTISGAVGESTVISGVFTGKVSAPESGGQDQDTQKSAIADEKVAEITLTEAVSEMENSDAIEDSHLDIAMPNTNESHSHDNLEKTTTVVGLEATPSVTVEFSEQELESYLDDLEDEFNQSSISKDTSKKEETNHMEAPEKIIISEETLPIQEESVVDENNESIDDADDDTETITAEEMEHQLLLELEEEQRRQMEIDHEMALKLTQEEAEMYNESNSSKLLNTDPDLSSPSTSSSVPTDESPPEDPEYRSLMALGHEAPFWVPDDTHDSCMQCDQKFSLLKRRHHCRCCGELLCATCCSFRAHLEYMRQQKEQHQQQSVAADASVVASAGAVGTTELPEARICNKCNSLFIRRDELLQLRYLADCGIGKDSDASKFPIKSVLKKSKKKSAAAQNSPDEDEGNTTGTEDNVESPTTTPTKNVMFSDGVRPGHDDGNDSANHRRKTRKPTVTTGPVPVLSTQTTTESESVARAMNNYKAYVNALKIYYNIQTRSFLPTQKTHLPPLMRNFGGILPNLELKTDFKTCQDLCDFLKADKRNFLIQKQFYCSVKIIEYQIGQNGSSASTATELQKTRWCLNVTTNGLNLIGQPELIMLIEMNSSYFIIGSPNDERNLRFLTLLIRRIFSHFNKIFTRIHSEIQLELLAKRRAEQNYTGHQQLDMSVLYALDNRVIVTPFQYFNRLYVPPLSHCPKVRERDLNGNDESDESDKENCVSDKFAFLKNPNQRFIHSMDLHKITFGTMADPDFYLDFNAVLYARPSFQCLNNVVLPERPDSDYLFGLLVKQIEIPWAKLFPLRLLLRLGAEFQLYPWPLFNALDRKCLYTEFVENSIIHFLADFRNYTFSLSEISGLHMNMEHVKEVHDEEKVTVNIYLPKIHFKQVEGMINSSSDSIWSFFGTLNEAADGHLVCIQQLDETKPDSGAALQFSTQSLNIETNQSNLVTRTGLNFFVLNGALKSSTGLKAKMNIIEDGIMVQVLPGIMQQVKSALLDMKDFTIECGENREAQTPFKLESNAGNTDAKKDVQRENIKFIWTNANAEKYPSRVSVIDGECLAKCSCINVFCDYNRKLEHSKSAVVPKNNVSAFGSSLKGNQSNLEMDCFYMHLNHIVLLEENSFFSLFNKKIEIPDDNVSLGDNIDDANLIKSLNVTNWEVPSVNFMVKLAVLLGRIINRALSKHLTKLYFEKYRRLAVRFHFDPDQIVTYEAGGLGTKLPLSYMNDLDMELIPVLHHIILESNSKGSGSTAATIDTSNTTANVNNIGHNLTAEFLGKIHLLQNIRHTITFELVFDILVDLP